MCNFNTFFCTYHSQTSFATFPGGQGFWICAQILNRAMKNWLKNGTKICVKKHLCPFVSLFVHPNIEKITWNHVHLFVYPFVCLFVRPNIKKLHKLAKWLPKAAFSSPFGGGRVWQHKDRCSNGQIYVQTHRQMFGRTNIQMFAHTNIQSRRSDGQMEKKSTC